MELIKNALQQCIKIIAKIVVKSRVVAASALCNLTGMKPAIGYIFLCETLYASKKPQDFNDRLYLFTISLLNGQENKLGFSFEYVPLRTDRD